MLRIKKQVNSQMNLLQSSLRQSMRHSLQPTWRTSVLALKSHLKSRKLNLSRRSQKTGKFPNQSIILSLSSLSHPLSNLRYKRVKKANSLCQWRLWISSTRTGASRFVSLRRILWELTKMLEVRAVFSHSTSLIEKGQWFRPLALMIRQRSLLIKYSKKKFILSPEVWWKLPTKNSRPSRMITA